MTDEVIKVIRKCPCQWLWPPQGWSHYDNCEILIKEREDAEWFEGEDDDGKSSGK